MLLTGHSSAQSLAVNQPEKLAAFEGHYRSGQNAPLWLTGIVDEQNRKVYGIPLGGWLSYLAFGSSEAKVSGLEDLPSDEFLLKMHPNASPEELEKIRPQYWAPVSFSFHSFRGMVFLGSAMGALIALGLLLWNRGKLFDANSNLSRIFLYCCVPSVALPIAASQIGWAAAEVGRQPWIVWHVLKTSDAVTTAASAGEILLTTAAFTLVFTAVSAVFLYAFFKKIKTGPEGAGNGY